MESTADRRRNEEVEALLNEAAVAAKPKKARVIPLTNEELTADSGLPYVFRRGPTLKFKGKGFEADDLNKLCMFYKDWAHQIAPKLTFDAFTEKVDKMCRTRYMKNYWDGLSGRFDRNLASANVVEDDGQLDQQSSVDEFDSNDHTPVETVNANIVDETNYVDTRQAETRRVVVTSASFGFDDAEPDLEDEVPFDMEY
eukprot:Partr_v1_DN28444_c0_g1_i1_m42160 putative Forms a fork protection complex (FPC) with tof1 and which is required for chromosome segregation during meiosis and DNA damage repair. FPC coordinates leading and lagging strand synthesis and moves with the replication fork. FPC stabilizes replication forks in a configuration that is recognized by replication checkpoint sensors (By similarity)